MSEVGKLSQKCHELDVEWEIENFFSFVKEDKCLNSPFFTMLDDEWYIKLYPNGETSMNSVGWIGLYLQRNDHEIEKKSVNFTFGFKRADGTIEEKPEIKWMFEDDYSGYGFPKLIQRSELVRRKLELVPSDTLTIICTIRVLDSSNCTTVLKTMSQNFKDLFASEKSWDVKMKVADTIFRVHKSVLVARSSVFAAMFTHDMSENNSGEVNIEDCDPGTFKEFLLYLYTGRFECCPINIFHLYEIADKYNVNELKSVCVSFMMSHLSVENICDTISFGHKFKESALNEKTQKYFEENFGKMASTITWKKFMKENCDLASQLLENMAPKIQLKKK